MYSIPQLQVEQGRITDIPYLGSDASYGNNGAFNLFCPLTETWLNVIASDGAGWEHVSVTVANLSKRRPKERRCPSWEEMQWIKEQFWRPDETVVQYHPAQSDYINCHPYCLHLWKPRFTALPLPPTFLIGPQL